MNWVFIAAVIMMSAVGIARAQAPQVLLREYKCYVCHADDETKTGPAYVDVAAKYRGNPQAVAIVAGMVRKGSRSGGPWHMPPHPEVSTPMRRKWRDISSRSRVSVPAPGVRRAPGLSISPVGGVATVSTRATMAAAGRPACLRGEPIVTLV